MIDTVTVKSGPRWATSHFLVWWTDWQGCPGDFRARTHIALPILHSTVDFTFYLTFLPCDCLQACFPVIIGWHFRLHNLMTCKHKHSTESFKVCELEPNAMPPFGWSACYIWALTASVAVKINVAASTTWLGLLYLKLSLGMQFKFFQRPVTDSWLSWCSCY